MLALSRRFNNYLNIPSLCKNISTTARVMSEELFTHKDTCDNNPNTPFEFTPDNKKRIHAIIKNYPISYQYCAVSSCLDIAQRQCGWVPISAMHKIAEILSMPKIRVYEFATFYTMYKRRYRGKFHVKVCTTTPCMLRGSDVILETVEIACCCSVGGLSPDMMFGVDTVMCQGACANAPVLVVNDDYYEDLTVCDVYDIIKCLQCGGIPPPGPRNGRFAAEPICGLTSLLECPPGPGFGLRPDLK